MWIFGLPLLYAGAAFLFLAFGMLDVTRAMASVYSGFLGAEAALAGAIEAVQATSGFPAPSLTRWIGASLLWGAGGLLLLFGVARRRRE